MNKTSVDWWAWRSRGGLEAHQKALQATFSDAPAPAMLKPRKGGYMGYEASAQILVGDLDVGLIAWGGENQKGWTYTSISGVGCSWVSDWDRAQDAAADCGEYEPRRVDIALDTFDGSSSFDKTLEAYRAGGFTTSGRPPKCEPMKPERSEDSAIIRIGNRASNKYLRGYEKGKQQMGPAIAAAIRKDPESFEAADWVMMTMPMIIEDRLVGVSVWDWWRLELELKPQTAALPEDVIDRRDQYFAGAYPYLGTVLDGVEAEALVMRRERGPQLDLALALEAIKKQYGSTLFTACAAHHGDMGAVWDRIVGTKHNERLIRSGVLMVDHG